MIVPPRAMLLPIVDSPRFQRPIFWPEFSYTSKVTKCIRPPGVILRFSCARSHSLRDLAEFGGDHYRHVQTEIR